MKKRLILILSIVIILIFATGCNKQIFDFNYHFDYVVIYDTGGNIVKEGEIESWTDYEDGEQLQITFEDGEVWLTSSFRCDLIER